MTLEELLTTDRAVVTVPEAGSLFELGASSSYEAAQRGDIPTVAVGRRRWVPVLELRRMLGVADPPGNGDGPPSTTSEGPSDVSPLATKQPGSTGAS